MGKIRGKDLVSAGLLSGVTPSASGSSSQTRLEQRIEELYNDGCTVAQMREELGVTHGALSRARQRMGLVTPRAARRNVKGRGKRAPFAVKSFAVPRATPPEITAPVVKTKGTRLVGGVDPSVFTPEFRQAEIAAMVILSSVDYDMFVVQDQNRGLVHKTGDPDSLLNKLMLRDNMWKAFAIDCYRRDDGFLVIRAGQNRFAEAKSLGIPILYTISSPHITISEIERSSRAWNGGDYLASNIKNPEYSMLAEYMLYTRMPESQARKVLAREGTNSHTKFADGGFVIEDEGRSLEMIGVLAEYFKVLKAAVKTSVRYTQLMHTLKAISWLTLSGEVEMGRMLYKIETHAGKAWDSEARSFKAFAALFETIYNRGYAADHSKYVYLDAVLRKERGRQSRGKRRRDLK